MEFSKRIFKGKGITLRAKTLLIVSATLVGLLVILFLVSQNIFLGSVADVEKRDTQENVQRALNALSDNVAQLATIVGDWAPWNDTYEFVEDVNETYIASNLIDTTFNNLNLNLMMFMNSSGQIVFGKAFDLQNQQEVPIPQGIEEQLSTDSILVHHTDAESTISGLVLLSEEPMLIASHPILTSEHEGPIRGALIMGRYLDSAAIESLAENTRLSITLHQFDEQQMPPDFEVATTALSTEESIFVRPIDTDSIGGYAFIRDIYGNPVLILRTDMPREIYHQGQMSLLYFIIALSVVGLAFGLVTLLLLEKSVLSPLSRLSSSVIGIGKSGDISARIEVTGSKELARLGREINGMLEAVQNSQKAQRKSEEQYSALVESLTDAVFRIKGKEIDWCNDRVSEIYGYTKNELIGQKASLLFPIDVNAWQFLGKVSTAIKERGVFRGEAKVKSKDGRIIDVEYTISQIGGKEPVELVAVARDITQRRLTEKALQGVHDELETWVQQRTSELVKANEKLALEVAARREAEEALRYSEEYLRVLMENALDVILVINADATIRYKSASFNQMVGEPRAGKNPLEFVHPEDMQYAMETLGQVIGKPGTTIQTEIRGEHSDGSWHTFEVMARNLLDHPVVKGILVNFHDITEHKRLEQERARVELLQESEEKLRRLIEEMDDGYCVIQDYEIVFVNSRGAEMFGYKPEEVMGKTIQELLPSKMAEELAGVYKDSGNSTALPSKHQITLIHKDGTACPVELGARFTEFAGKPAISFVIRDITERKRMEEELRRREQDYLLLLESIYEGIIVFDAETLKVVFGNRRAARMFGFDPVLQDGIGVNLLDFVHPEDREVILKGLAEDLFTSERRRRYEVRAKTKDGREIWVSALATRVEFQGRLAILLSLKDITESKSMEKALQHSEEKFRNVLDNSLDMIYRLNFQTGKYEYVSPASGKILGYSPEELMETGLEKTRAVIHPDDLGRLDENALELISSKQGVASSVEYRIKHKELGYRWVNDSRSIVYGEGNMPIAIVGSIRDIDERRQAEEKKRKLEEQIQLAGRLAAVGELAAGVAHELNNPIAAIKGFAQLLAAKEDVDAGTKKDLQTIFRESQRASKITQNLLTFARRHEPEKRFISINEALEKTLELRAHQMKLNNIELVEELDPNLPRTMADFHQMQQVFLNIINNAEQAMVEAHGKGKLIVRTRKVGGMIQINFIDDGPGISEENLERIFDPFFTTKEVGKGTGLGLSICYGLVEAHYGRMYVKSKLGKGATFVVEIPIVSEEQVATESPALGPGSRGALWKKREEQY